MSIALHGSYFGFNFGDTLLCNLFRQYLSDAAPEEGIVLPLANERNRELIGANEKGLLAARTVRGLVFCGGGYFSQPPIRKAPHWSHRAYLRHVWLAEQAMRRSIPFGFLGVGAGPLKADWLRRRVRTVLDAATVVVVRDHESAEFLGDLGTRAAVRVAPDAVISLTPDTPLARRGKSAALGKAKTSGKRTLLIHTACHPSAHDLDVMMHAAAWAAGRDDLYVILLDDSVSLRPVTWQRAVLRAQPSLRARSSVVPYDRNPENHIALIGGVDGIVTTKLHVGIVGCAMEKPVISMPGHSKTPRFYNQVGLSQQCLSQSGDWRSELTQKLNDWADGYVPDLGQLRRVRESFSYPDAVRTFVRQLPPSATSAGPVPIPGALARS